MLVVLCYLYTYSHPLNVLGVSYMGRPIFYKWDGIGLSLVSSSRLITHGARDIEAFSIHEQQYIAVANYKNDQKSHHLDSEVYLYNIEGERYVHFY